LSAHGLVLAPAAYDIARTRKTPLQALDFRALADGVKEMQAEIAAKLQEVENFPASFEVTLGLGYIGQSYHVPVSVDAENIAMLTVRDLLARFADEYRGKYGYFYDDVPVELVTVHVAGVAGTETRSLPAFEMSGGDASTAVRERRDAYSMQIGSPISFEVYRRDSLKPGMTFEGPCLIEEDSSTTVVDVGARVTIDRFGSLDIVLGSTE
jgi:N-methylhydantoinase A